LNEQVQQELLHRRNSALATQESSLPKAATIEK
jgi:hypothetical protein